MSDPIIAAERAVLGACLHPGSSAFDLVTAETGLASAHFGPERHRLVFAALEHLHNAGHGIDIVTVAGYLDQQRQLDAVGGQAAVDELAAFVPLTGHASTYAQQVIEGHRWRLREQQRHRIDEALRARDDAAFQAAILPPDEPDRGDEVTPDTLGRRLEAILDAAPTDGLVPTPWPRINDALHGGARRGDTTIISGWSSMGKSVAALDWLDHIGQQGGHVGLYTNEMAVDDVTARLIAATSGVPFWRIMRRDLTPPQRDRIRIAYPQLRLSMIPAFGWPWQDIARHLRRRKWDLCCLDLFNGLPGLERTSDIDTAIRGLVNAAGQAGTHLIVVSQLNQERSKGAERPVPTGRDLRGSGAMFNDPANVVFIHRDQEIDDDGVAHRLDTGSIRLDKARNGQPGATEKVTLDSDRMRFDHGEAWRGRHLVEEAQAA